MHGHSHHTRRLTGGAVCAGFHIRLPGNSGKQTLSMLQRLLASSKFQADMRERERLTVDDGGLSIHCMMQRGLVLLACTTPEYPQRLVFPPSTDGAVAVGLLAHIGDVATGANVPAPSTGTSGVQVYSFPGRVEQALERACADHEDVRSRDPVLRVQAEVDEVPLSPDVARILGICL